MNTVVDEVLAGSPRYNIKNNSGTTLYSNVQIDLATTVTTAGTPLNKVLFDSIQEDLNTRLLISNKATTAEAQAGTNDTKYMTPLKTKQALQNQKTVTTFATGTTSGTIFTFNNSSTKTIKITGAFGVPAYYSSSYPSITLGGTQIGLHSFAYRQASFEHNIASSFSFTLGKYDNSSQVGKAPFFLEFDMATKTLKGTIAVAKTGTITTFDTLEIMGVFTTLTTLTFSKNTNVPLTVSIEELY